jgi:hypothetical protein
VTAASGALAYTFVSLLAAERSLPMPVRLRLVEDVADRGGVDGLVMEIEDMCNPSLTAIVDDMAGALRDVDVVFLLDAEPASNVDALVAAFPDDEDTGFPWIVVSGADLPAVRRLVDTVPTELQVCLFVLGGFS